MPRSAEDIAGTRPLQHGRCAAAASPTAAAAHFLLPSSNRSSRRRGVDLPLHDVPTTPSAAASHAAPRQFRRAGSTCSVGILRPPLCSGRKVGFDTICPGLSCHHSCCKAGRWSHQHPVAAWAVGLCHAFIQRQQLCAPAHQQRQGGKSLLFSFFAHLGSCQQVPLAAGWV
jgi:hypothetical protein